MLRIFSTKLKHDFQGVGHLDQTHSVVFKCFFFLFSSDVVRLLLEYGACVNQRDKAHYKTALHVACEAQNVACVQYLLDAGADPNVQAESGLTPLHIGM